MTMTRDQLRAARILLHIEQPELAKRAKMGVATLRRFEGGQKVGEIYVDALQREIERAGAVLIQGSISGPVGAEIGCGVALRPTHELPADTVARINGAASKDSAQEVNEAGASGANKEATASKKRRRKTLDLEADQNAAGSSQRRTPSRSKAADAPTK